MNILNIVKDDKFIEFFMQHLATDAQVSSKYVVLVDELTEPLKHISLASSLWRVVDKSYVLSSELKEDLQWCDCLVIHYMEHVQAQIVLSASSSVIIVWSGWGRDYYPFLDGVAPPLIDSATARLVSGLEPENNYLGKIKKKIHDSIQAFGNNRLLLKALTRVDLFSSPIPDDYELLKLALNFKFRARYVQLNYASVEKTFMIGSSGITGENILVGNSATMENNHLEAFNLLSNCELGQREVIVPLSYGHPKYREAIIFHGKKILGNNFRDLTQFTTLDNYSAIVSSCSIAIMNQKRQQALGNIGTLLQKGAKVFFDQENVVFHFFKNRGAHVFSKEQFLKNKSQIFEPLSESQVQENLVALDGFWSERVVHNNYSNFIDAVYELRRSNFG